MKTRIRRTLVAAAALALAGCASAGPATPPSVNITGKWAGNWQFNPVSAGAGQVFMDLTQDGNKVSGSVLVTGPSPNQPTTIAGTVTGNDFVLSGRIAGTFVVNGDKMTGDVYGVLPATATLMRQK